MTSDALGCQGMITKSFVPKDEIGTTAARLAAEYRRTLLEDIVPFWLCHALDPSGELNSRVPMY